jgi:hypothetical protein
MAKFYVESGSLRLVISANNSRGAALWAVHRVLSGVLPFAGDECEQTTNRDGQRFKLGEAVYVNQRGFDHSEGRRFETVELVTEWSQLISALSRLEQDLLEPVVAGA